jgi:hypothetical protein
MDDIVKKNVDTLKERLTTAALEVATPQWCRAYWRAHNTKLVEMIEKQMPQEVRGAGPLGEHVFKVVHSIKQSPLDGELPALEGELVRKVESSG